MTPAATPEGMFGNSEKCIEAHSGKLGNISIDGQS